MTDLNTISPDLYEPFLPDLLRWQVVAHTDGGKKVQVIPYIAVQHLEDRLNLHAPGWSKSFTVIEPDMVVRCELTVCGVTRIGLGSGDRSQDAKTYQAFVQACQAFGVGRYLRYMKAVWVSRERVQANPDGTLIVDVSIPAWALPGGGGRPSAVAEKASVGEPAVAEKPEPTGRVSALDFVNQLPKTRPLDTDFASAYELKIYGDLYLKAKLSGVDLSSLNVIIPPIAVGELRRRYSALNKLYQEHTRKKGE